MLVDRVAIAIFDLGDSTRIAMHAARGKCRIAFGHLDRRYANSTEGERWVGGQIFVDTACLSSRDNLVGANGGSNLGVAGVTGEFGCSCKGNRAVARVAVVLHGPRVGDCHRRVAVEGDVRVHAVANSCCKSKGLKARAWLPLSLCCEVVLARVVVATANHSLDVASVGVDCDECTVEFAIANGCELLVDGLLGCLLASGIDGGVDLESALKDGVGGEVLLQETLDVVGPVRIGTLGIVGGVTKVELEFLGLCRIVLFLGNIACSKHAVENCVAPLNSLFGVNRWVVVGGRLGQTNKKCGLGQCEVGSALVEVGLRGNLDAICTVAIVNGVEIHQEDLLFGVGLFHLDGDIGLANLALECLVVALVRKNRVSY